MPREYVVLKTLVPTEKHGYWPDRRPLEVLMQNGIVVVDKPMGPTSHQVTVWVRKMLGVSTAGHVGTLDPRVTGVLPVLLGNGTKLVSYLQGSAKEYVGIMRLHGNVPKERVEEVFREFTGPIYQIPPLRSAVKRALRVREIYSLDILEMDGRDVLFRTRCQGGTYIRRLVHDMGLVLGVGANMQELRRTESATFREGECIRLHDLLDAYEEWKESGEEKWLRGCVRPIEDAVRGFKAIHVKDSAVSALCHGAPLTLPGIAQMEKDINAGESIAILTLKGELIGMGKAVMGTEEVVNRYLGGGRGKGIVATLERVIMPRDLYPKEWHHHRNGGGI